MLDKQKYYESFNFGRKRPVVYEKRSCIYMIDSFEMNTNLSNKKNENDVALQNGVLQIHAP